MLRRLCAVLACSALAACGGAEIVDTSRDGGNDAGRDAGQDGGNDGGGILNTGDAGPCPTDPPGAPIGDATVTAGATNKFLLKGRVATPESLFEPGQVLVVNDKFACVGADCSGDPNAAGATVIDTKGVIFPGLVDAHNHTQYNYLPPWPPPQLFQNRAQWAARSDYKAWTASIGANEDLYKCEQIKYGEIRALMGGTTTIEGTWNASALACFKTLVHNAEHGGELQVGTADVRTNIGGISTINATDAADLRTKMLNGTIQAYVIHLAEGIDQKSRDEFSDLVSKGLLLPPMVLIHATALQKADFDQIAAANAKVVWSPLSNLLLYGATTDVKTALTSGVSVSLAPDWTLSGSASVLGELRVARTHSCDSWGGNLSAIQLVKMVTSTPADAMGLTSKVGRLAPGLLADVLVIADRGQDAHRTLVEAKLGDVRMVMIGGNLRYGDSTLVAATGRTPCEELPICGVTKRLCVPDTSDPTNKLNQSFTDIKNVIQGFYANPYRLDVCD